MKAITLWPEWSWAFSRLDKMVENRGWMHGLPPGELLAIHAGAYIGGRKGLVARDEGMAALVSQARLARWQISGPTWKLGSTTRIIQKPGREDVWIGGPAIRTSAIVAVGRVAQGPPAGAELGWAVPGCRHWWFDQVWRLPTPVRCTGHQGLWPVAGELAEQVNAQLDRVAG